MTHAASFPVRSAAAWLRLPLLAMWLAAAPVAAQVIEIGDDGTTIRHDGPALYLTPDMRPVPIRGTELPAPAVPAATAPLVGAPVSIAATIATAARNHGVSAQLVSAIAWHESRYQPGAVSSAGAIGVMQLMPATARALRVDPYDAAANIEGGVTLLASLLTRYRGDLVRALAAYDAGPAAVDRYGGVPPYRETRAYVASILERLSLLANSAEISAGIGR